MSLKLEVYRRSCLGAKPQDGEDSHLRDNKMWLQNTAMRVFLSITSLFHFVTSFQTALI